MQTAKPPVVTYANAPVCHNVSLTIQPVHSVYPDYQFRLTIQNNSSAPVVLPSRVQLIWELSLIGIPHANPRGGGRVSDESVDIKIAPGMAYTKTFEEPDLWGDEAGPHPAGRYRVAFTYFYRSATGDASLGPLPCALHASPIVFVEPSIAKRRQEAIERRRQRLPY